MFNFRDEPCLFIFNTVHLSTVKCALGKTSSSWEEVRTLSEFSEGFIVSFLKVEAPRPYETEAHEKCSRPPLCMHSLSPSTNTVCWM